MLMRISPLIIIFANQNFDFVIEIKVSYNDLDFATIMTKNWFRFWS
jgi:hypothetical protein